MDTKLQISTSQNASKMLVSNPCFRNTTPLPLALKSDRHDYLKRKRTYTISSFISLAVKVLIPV